MADFEAHLRTSSGAVRIEAVSDRDFSEAELNDRVTSTHFLVFEDVSRAEGVSTEADPVTGRISVTIGAAARDRTVVQEDAQQLLPSDVEVRVVWLPHGGDDATHKGGQPTTSCTSGFVVKQNSLRGVATAAHCSDQQSMNGVALNYVFAHNGTYGDMQWHTRSGDWFPDDFLAGNATTWNANNRDVAGNGYPVVGQDVCKNGKNGFRDCDVIKALGHCHNGACNLVRVYQRQAEGGDSGGPWYWGNAAYGLHKGYNLHDWAYRDLFTRSDYLGNGMLVEVAYT